MTVIHRFVVCHCQMAAERLEREIAQGRLWEPGEQQKPRQEVLPVE